MLRYASVATTKRGIMMTDVATVRRTYPWTTSIDGVRLTFRLMQPSDREAILAIRTRLCPMTISSSCVVT